ncbi:hypothetical protein BACCIP111895_04533 [Neobacillus rhizosphaerae]|uniref:VanZ-like domain-containing protein n=1 Tax=Neobacillus rhizosphaerae TaxID=2880965 RepID=A0ABM9EYK1_9BACI|nr:hypothetical protein [Neobacillus rhizosphaerae]CAH2717341.1 hypothetical protein BACCIP111895_04533 [Neobacillus rhizosphaerae]
MKLINTLFEPVSNLSKKQKILWLFFFLILFTEIITRILKIDSMLVQNIIDSLMGLCLIAFVLEMLFLKKKSNNN